MRSGCVNIHFKGNTQGKDSGGVSSVLSLYPNGGFVFEQKQREDGKKEGWMKGKHEGAWRDRRKRTELMWECRGLKVIKMESSEDRGRETGREEGMIVNIYGWEEERAERWSSEQDDIRMNGEWHKKMKWEDWLKKTNKSVKMEGWRRTGGAEVTSCYNRERNGWIQLFNGKPERAM